jgi:hypothetical protein
VSPAVARTVDSAGRSSGPGTRNGAVDLFRGLGLWILFIDHIEPNFWTHFTPAQFGFSDFAEIFIFLSGYINAGMYGRALETGGTLRALRKLRERVVKIYAAHIASMAVGFAILVIFASRGLRLNEPILYLWTGAPVRYSIRTLTLLYAPHWFALLPLYIVLAPVTLLAVMSMRRRPVLTLTASLAVWCIGQLHWFDLQVMTSLQAWYFRPLAWQFLAVLGAMAGMYWERVRRAPESGVIVACAAAIVAVAFGLKIAILMAADPQRLFGVAVYFRLLAHDAGKERLSLFRLLHFLSLVILVTAIPWNTRKALQSLLARAAIGVGRDSLVIFCVTLALTPVVNLLLQHYRGGLPAQLACSVLGVALMSAIAYARGKVAPRSAL